ncbi:hypothetical protein BHE90_009465 [Fusarium euwallaceae]|uniref:Uncharacterized protein n=2 Tax=Fusarium solani species complex TaxID=232080 RepID=A0A430LK15_9HYPO|nr:hypothetical protein CEP51_003436 [Fusarium floridanum]RTE76072.1 hypothetical protein BHE90_009465 [Fusarium euwallaceae]
MTLTTRPFAWVLGYPRATSKEKPVLGNTASDGTVHAPLMASSPRPANLEILVPESALALLI